MSLEVLRPGNCSLIVDAGRPSSRRLGVPISGAADRWSWRLGNALLGNEPQTPALEIAATGPRLHARHRTAGVVLGAPFEVSINGEPWPEGKTFCLAPGDRLEIGGVPIGVRAYLCVVGGFDCPAVLGSRSSLTPLKAPAALACAETAAPIRWSPALSFAQERQLVLRVLPGLQEDWFRTADFYHGTFVVSGSSNRMGLRLAGPAIRPPQRELVSEPVSPGDIQVTRDGQCIILGVDGQTIGGYPKVAHVIQADHDILGQARPGTPIRFQSVTAVEAIKAYQERETELWRWCTRLRASLADVRPERTSN